jgi:hypothetical protein
LLRVGLVQPTIYNAVVCRQACQCGGRVRDFNQYVAVQQEIVEAVKAMVYRWAVAK